MSCTHLRSSGVVPVILHRGLMSSVGLSMLVQLSHWSPRASYARGTLTHAALPL
jgi:hypothetical protein